MSTILAHAGRNTAGKIVYYTAAYGCINCPRLSSNVIHQLLHSGWTVLVNPVFQIPPQRPATLEELMDNIGKETWAIDTATCRRVIDNFARRNLACIRQNGGHIDHVLDAHNSSDHNKCVYNLLSLYVTYHGSGRSGTVFYGPPCMHFCEYKLE